LDANELTLHAYFDDQDGRSILVMDLYHDSGEKMPTSRLWIRVKKTTKTDKNGEVTITEDNPQDAGSGITYATRYCVATYLGIPLEDEDDDGNIASGNTQNRYAKHPNHPPQQSQEQPRQAKAAEAEAGGFNAILTSVQDKERELLPSLTESRSGLRIRLAGTRDFGTDIELLREYDGKLDAELATVMLREYDGKLDAELATVKG
jgi:hypothetical protein